MEPGSTFFDVKAFLAELEAEGSHIEVDGWAPRIVGRRPSAERWRTLSSAKLPILYHLASVAPRRCETCGGVATRTYREEEVNHQFCSAHEPVHEGLYLLWQAARNKERFAREVQRMQEEHDPRGHLLEQLLHRLEYWSQEVEVLEGQLQAG